MDKQGIFRKVALDRLSSPERLDQLIQVTGPRAWLALVALVVLLAAFTGWGILGSISTRVRGQGILLGGNVYDVTPTWPGRVVALNVEVGGAVAAGDLVAELAQPELTQQIENARARLADLEAEHAYVESVGERELATQQAFYGERRANLERNIEELDGLLGLIADQLAAEERLFAQGLVTPEQLIPVRQRHSTARTQLAATRAELTQVGLDEINARFVIERRRITSEQAVHDAERTLRQLENDHLARSKIFSAYSGRVLEIAVDVGSVITPGQSVIKIALTENDVGALRAVLYVSADDGKRVEPGMQILVAPSTVRPEEYGYLLGRVRRIADFPATQEGMQRVLKNDQLVRQLSSVGPPFELEAELTRDPVSPSGYAWTSGGGPSVSVLDGTPVLGLVIVETRRPVEMVIPGIRKALSLQ